ncbi:hypothetical protein [Yersinia rochesterensis]|nr:hypothetical protein [Yersinia rochesterensis]
MAMPTAAMAATAAGLYSGLTPTVAMAEMLVWLGSPKMAAWAATR